MNTEYPDLEHKVKTNESKNLKTDEAAQAKGHHIHDEESKMKDNKLTNKISWDKVQARIINMERDNKKLVNRPRRKNTLKKIILDTSWCVMVAETEDLIIEYSMRREMITNHYIKEEEQESPYCKTRKQHLRDWPDDTLRIEEEGHGRGSVKIPKTTAAIHCLSLNLQKQYTQRANKTVYRVDAYDIRRSLSFLLLFCCQL